MAGGHFGSACATRSDWASSSSAVATPVATIASTEAAAAWRSGKTSSPVATWGSTSTVRKTAEATNPSVPSLPMARWTSISTGSSWSSSELRP